MKTHPILRPLGEIAMATVYVIPDNSIDRVLETVRVHHQPFGRSTNSTTCVLSKENLRSYALWHLPEKFEHAR